jgi:predicted RNA-binding Zn-ribbon protein involved in translation (DUF1610 family)
MFYCPNCNNIFDITRSIDNKQQVGGDNNSSSLSSTQSSTQKLSESNIKLLINKLLDHVATLNDVKNIDYGEVIKSNSYKSLNNNERETVINGIQDLLPNEKKKIMEFKNNVDIEANAAYFICTNCGHARTIENGTLIFSRKSENITQSYDIGDYSDLKYSNILPRTRNYICINDKCDSHTDMKKKEAIFFRVGGYNVKYVCLACDTIF